MSDCFNFYAFAFKDKISAIRGKELDVLKKSAYYDAFATFSWHCTPFLVSNAILIVFCNIMFVTTFFPNVNLFYCKSFVGSVAESVKASFLRRPGSHNLASTRMYPGHVVASQIKVLHDDYLCLVASDK